MPQGDGGVKQLSNCKRQTIEAVWHEQDMKPDTPESPLSCGETGDVLGMVAWISAHNPPLLLIQDNSRISHPMIPSET